MSTVFNPFTGTLDYVGGSSTGTVTASAIIADEAIVRGDGGAYGVQTSPVFITDLGNMTIGDGSQSFLSISFRTDATVPSITAADTGLIYTSHAFTSTGTFTGPGNAYIAQNNQPLTANVFQNTDTNGASGVRAAKFTATQTNTGGTAYTTGVESYGIRSGAGNAAIGSFVAGAFNFAEFTGTGTQGYAMGFYGKGFVNNASGTISNAFGVLGQEFDNFAGTLTRNYALGSNGAFLVADGTTSADGIQFTSALGTASDVSLYRSASGALLVSGNLGIGVTPGSNKLNITTTGSVPAIFITGDDPSNAMVKLSNSAGRTYAFVSGVTGVSNTGFSVRDITGSFDIFTVGATGLFGVGTQSPGAKFSVESDFEVKDTTHTRSFLVDASGNCGIGGIGSTSIPSRLWLLRTTEQLRVGYDGSNYWKTTISSTGSATLDLVGTSPKFTFSDPVIISNLTSGRIPFATTSGELTDDADLTFATDTLTATKIIGTTSIKAGTAAGYLSSDGSAGATGSFTTVDLKTVTVKDGLITQIV